MNVNTIGFEVEEIMRIVNLIENIPGSTGCLAEHGLSFYIETENHKLLVDTGSTNAFIENANMLGIDLKAVDIVILSHGHYDHSGGIPGFAQLNSHAGIWMQKAAAADYYHKSETEERYIGIDKTIMELPQVKYVEGNQKLDEELFLFSGVTGRRLWPLGNRVLTEKRDNAFYQDEFTHEQYLVINAEGKKILVSGCAHNGILNILDAYREIYGENPDVVISGFHMMKKNGYSEEDLEIVRNIGQELKQMNTKFYTGHCTGEVPYEILKEILGEQIEYVNSGDEVKFV